MKQFISYSLLFVILSCSFTAAAQLDGVQQKDVKKEDNVFLDGVVSDYFTGDVLAGAYVKAVADGKTTAKGYTDGKGKYEMLSLIHI